MVFLIHESQNYQFQCWLGNSSSAPLHLSTSILHLFISEQEKGGKGKTEDEYYFT